MPTGYTAAIADGIDFNTFAMGCARAFGACITLRDEPSGTPNPERFEPSGYHAEKVAEAKAELARLESMSTYAVEQEANAANAAAAAYQENRIREIDALRAKYEAMLAHASAFVPPSADHVHFKEFMVQQITDSIKWDCDGVEIAGPAPLSATEWLQQRKDQQQHDIEYHTKSYAEEVERAESRTRWVQDLRRSLMNK